MRLFVDITAHGWGHLAQTAPIIEALRSRVPDLECVVRSGVPETLLRNKLGPLAAFHPSDTDFGVVMESPFAVDCTATLERYRALHTNFERRVEEVAGLIRREHCDIVLSNVGYLALAAAKQADVPAVACSSLEWGGMVRFYCAGLPGAEAIAAEIDAAYAGADRFVQLLPSMAIDRWPTIAVERAIARLGTSRRPALVEQSGARSNDVIVLCVFGGMLPDSPPMQLLRTPGIVVVGPDAWRAEGVVPLSAVDLPYEDVLASVDVVVTKPGYGTIAELGCLGTPSVMVSRGNWPEEEAHVDWLARHAAVERRPMLDAVTPADLCRLAARPRTLPLARAGGEADVADIVLDVALKPPALQPSPLHEREA
jgi:hypothetical protein